MTTKFNLAVKSTLDRVMASKAQELGLTYTDIDDMSAIRKATDSSVTMLLGHLQTLADKGNRLHDGLFGAGCKLSSDPGNYSLISLTDDLAKLFPLTSQINVRDWSGSIVGPVLGVMVVRSSGLQSTDIVGEANVRFINIGFEAYEFV